METKDKIKIFSIIAVCLTVIISTNNLTNIKGEMYMNDNFAKAYEMQDYYRQEYYKCEADFTSYKNWVNNMYGDNYTHYPKYNSENDYGLKEITTLS